MAKRFRFGVNFVEAASGREWADKCRLAESLGYDVLLVADHLGRPAPFPSLVAAAQATERPRVGTFVLNAGFWNPTLLAREVATADRLTRGRLEIGLGAGYVRAEFDAAGIPFGTPGSRVDHLERTVTELLRLLADPEHAPHPERGACPPLLLGGNGKRVLRMAARYADIMAFTGAEQDPDQPDGAPRLLEPDRFAERVAGYRGLVDDRDPVPELNILVQRVVVTDDRAKSAQELRAYGPHMTLEELLRVPTLLIGTVPEITGQLRAMREELGITYITVLESSMEAMAPVIARLRHEEP